MILKYKIKKETHGNIKNLVKMARAKAGWSK